jgi:hypothetical protein
MPAHRRRWRLPLAAVILFCGWLAFLLWMAFH